LVSWGSDARRAGATLVVLAAASAACSLVTTFDGFSGGGGGADAGPTDDALVPDVSSDGGIDSPEPPAIDAGSQTDSPGDDTSTTDSGTVDSPVSDSSATDSPASDSGASDSGASDSGASDSGNPDSRASDSGAADVAPDVSELDAGDASSDANQPWCATQPGPFLFCDDFDEAPLIVGFDAVNQMNCTAVLQSGTAVSAPDAMNATSTANVQTYNCGGLKTFPGQGAAATSYMLSFDIDPLTVDKSNVSDAVVAVIELIDAAGAIWSLQLEPVWDGANHHLSVYLSEDGETVDAGEQFHSTIAGATLPLTSWTRVSLELTVGPRNVTQTGQLFFNGTMIAAANLHPATTNPTVSFLLGYSYVAPNNASWSMLYDNVTFAAK
jgi:hypothetical protein